ncbi:MAG TPA: hypothetical protein VEU47_08695 [Candidatus Cybelea sp.]|nr:hypothetical protein [Candidatus Cybelea sp.]
MKDKPREGVRDARSDPDAFLADFFSRIPADTVSSFTDRQLMAIRMAFGARHRGVHTIDIRISLPLLWRRIYLVVLAGGERRSPNRRRSDRRRYPLATIGNALFGGMFFVLLGVAVLGFLYLLKSALGIDLIPGFSLGFWDAVRDQFNYLLH